MKIKGFLALAMTFMMIASCQTKQETGQYTFDWDFTQMVQVGYSIDSAKITVDGKLVQMVRGLDNNHLIAKGEIESPEIANVLVYVAHTDSTDSVALDEEGYPVGDPKVVATETTVDSFNVNIILEEGYITIDPTAGCGAGSPLNEAVLAVYKEIVAESQKKDFSMEKANSIITKFVTDHKDDVSSVFLLACSDFTSELGASEVKKLYNLLSDDMKKQPLAGKLSKKLESIANTTVGHKFTDFEAEYNGKVQRLSDYVGRGKPCLVDFWASWCVPCRQEIPNIKAVYAKYADRINVVGVASWDKPEDTQKAIEELGIQYPQIINAQESGTDAYNIQGIPEIILFSADGTILKRGLRGSDIMKAVEEVLK